MDFFWARINTITNIDEMILLKMRHADVSLLKMEHCIVASIQSFKCERHLNPTYTVLTNQGHETSACLTEELTALAEATAKIKTDQKMQNSAYHAAGDHHVVDRVTLSSSFSSSIVCLLATSSWTVWPQFFTTDSKTYISRPNNYWFFERMNVPLLRQRHWRSWTVLDVFFFIVLGLPLGRRGPRADFCHWASF